MAQDPLKPKQDDKIKLPKISAGMNKMPPKPTRADAEAKDYDGPGGDEPERDDDNDQPDEMDPNENQAGDIDDEDKAEFLNKVRKRFERCVKAESDNRAAGLSDIKFKRGRPEDQWPSDVLANRMSDRRPAITVNKIPTFVHQVTNDLRQNRPSIVFSPVGDKADRDAAKVFRGMVRAIERDSAADIAYDTAVESAVVNGWGWIRILTEFESEDSFDMTIKVSRVRNVFSVYADPDHQEPDGADIKYGFVTEMMPREEFKETYPDCDDPANFVQSGIGDAFKEWADNDNVRIAEYFEIEHETKTLVKLENGHVGYYDDLHDDVKEAIEANPDMIVDERETQVPKIMWYKVTALDIVDKREWPGKWIPFVKVIGDETDVEGKVEYAGIVRHMKGAQTMYNYWRTKQTEAIALAPNAPWVGEEGQFEGHEDEWRMANTRPQAVLQYKGTAVSGHPIPPPQRIAFAEIPAGFVNAVEGANQDMQGTSGIRFDATKNERLNDESGIAIKELRRSTDIGSLHYGDNLGRSLKHLGRMYLDLIPKIYTRKQVVTIIGEDDKEKRVTIDPHAPKAYAEQQGADGKTEIIFNPKIGKYGIQVTLGPSYATRRIENADKMIELTKAMPNAMAMAADLIVKNLEFDDADELSRRLAATLPPHLLAPEMKDMPPQAAAMLNSLQSQVQQLEQEKQQMGMALQSKQADRAIAQDKIDKDFEAKLLTVAQKAESDFQGRLNDQLNKLMDTIAQRMQPQGQQPLGGNG